MSPAQTRLTAVIAVLLNRPGWTAAGGPGHSERGGLDGVLLAFAGDKRPALRKVPRRDPSRDCLARLRPIRAPKSPQARKSRSRQMMILWFYRVRRPSPIAPRKPGE